MLHKFYFFVQIKTIQVGFNVSVRGIHVEGLYAMAKHVLLQLYKMERFLYTGKVASMVKIKVE